MASQAGPMLRIVHIQPPVTPRCGAAWCATSSTATSETATSMHEHLLPQPPPLPVPYPGGDSSLAAEQVHSHTMLRQLLQSILQMQEDHHAQ